MSLILNRIIAKREYSTTEKQCKRTLHHHDRRINLRTNDNNIETLLEWTIKKLKNREETGKDNINNKLLEYGGSQLTIELTKFFEIIIQKEVLPDNWKMSSFFM